MKSLIDLLASKLEAQQEQLLSQLSPNAQLSLLWLFDCWAHDHQLPPSDPWSCWLIMGGRGAGKTRAGSEWVRQIVEGNSPLDKGQYRRVALIGETLDQVRDVMIEGESGILACSPDDRRPKFELTKKRLVWANGAEAKIATAHDPESLRGPQFDAAWLDEFAKWPNAIETWHNLQFALRLGDAPRCLITTTPRANSHMRELLERPDLFVSKAGTFSNQAHLPDAFLEKVKADYSGTRLGRQEMEGEMLSEVEGALWSHRIFDQMRSGDHPPLDRVVVAIDPPVTSHAGSDACGIIVAGAVNFDTPASTRCFVLADWTIEQASPTQWAKEAVRAYRHFEADNIVAEVNQGGELVKTVLRQQANDIPVKEVRATRGKVVRAEPIVMLYEQGRVHHASELNALEDQMCLMTNSGFKGTGSPDRVDALVWALTDLAIDKSHWGGGPNIRTL